MKFSEEVLNVDVGHQRLEIESCALAATASFLPLATCLLVALAAELAAIPAYGILLKA